MKKYVSGMAGVAMLASALAFGQEAVQPPPQDPTLAIRDCEDFNAKSGSDKLDYLFERHMSDVDRSMDAAVSFPPLMRLRAIKSMKFMAAERTLRLRYMLPSRYLMPASHLRRFSGFVEQVTPAAELLAATTSFLVPRIGSHTGYAKLNHTLLDRCDEMKDNAKLVHGLASFAKAHLEVFPKLQKLKVAAQKEEGETRWEPTGTEVDNPWTGLFDPRANRRVNMLIRFSIANPVAQQISIPQGAGPHGGKSLLLEFIPGLGMKFMVDRHKNMDLVAMESLAGQGRNHNYFLKEFSPDFSRHAPPAYLADGPEKQYMLDRYASNPVNSWVMDTVGVRFEQALVATYSRTHPDYASRIVNRKLSDEQKRGRYGPHPFMIGIQGMAAVDTRGHEVPLERQKRPFRIVFEPAVNEIGKKTGVNRANEAERLGRIKDPTAHVPGDMRTDFRTKLAFLASGDAVYYLTAETESGARYRIGKIVLDSTPIPSRWQDRQYFVNHEIETSRLHDQELKARGETRKELFRIADPE